MDGTGIKEQMSKASQFIILCEDRLQEVFVRRFLTEYGVDGRSIPRPKLLAGNGCGEKYVREKYSDAIKACRTRHAKTALIVIIDADTETVENRQSQLNDALQSTDVSPRSDGEHIIHLIPKRHIETWLAFLSDGIGVNEMDKYKPQYSFRKKESETRPHIKKFVEMFRNRAQTLESLPSLKLALQELERLREILR